MRALSLVVLSTFCMVLAACGNDGGGGVNSAASVAGPASTQAPTPSAASTLTTEYVVGDPLAPTPALTSGTYNTLGIATSIRDGNPGGGSQTTRTSIAPGDLRITVDSATNTYTLAFDQSSFPGLTPPNGEATYTVDDKLYGHNFLYKVYSNGVLQRTESLAGTSASVLGSDSSSSASTQFTSDVGLSYVSLGSWAWDTYDPDSETCSVQTCDRGSVVFYYGNRTIPSAIPTSGTATYTMKASIGFPGNPPGSSSNHLTFMADFGARSISADIGYISRGYQDGYSPIASGYVANLSGSAPIQSSGDFDIALTGSLQNGNWTATGSGIDDVSPFRASGDPVAVTGTLKGAFFGPDASEIGASMLLSNQDGGMTASAIVASKN